MNSKDSAEAARRLRLALAWRAEWRRELATLPLEPSPAPNANDGDFAAAIARAEFGRHYFDAKRYRQTIDQGAVIWAAQKPRGKPG